MQFLHAELLLVKCLTTGIHSNTCNFHFMSEGQKARRGQRSLAALSLRLISLD